MAVTALAVFDFKYQFADHCVSQPQTFVVPAFLQTEIEFTVRLLDGSRDTSAEFTHRDSTSPCGASAEAPPAPSATHLPSSR